mgnify:CR=1 FL=1
MREFNEKNFLLLVQKKGEHNFIKLRQGTLSVAEYETQFTKLSKFTSELMVPEQRRVRWFIQGLNMKIQEALIAAQVNTITETLEVAQRIENAKTHVKTFHARKRSAPSSTHGELRENAMPSKVKEQTIHLIHN